MATLMKKSSIDPERLADQPMLSTNPVWKQLPEEYIRTRAYYLWEKAGRPECDGCEFWMQAEQELRGGK